MSTNKILFRASMCGKLLTEKKGSGITEIQRIELKTLKDKKDTKGLTAKQEDRLEYLITKKNKPFEFGDTAKSYIKSVWLREEFGYDEPIVVPEMLKGLLCEQDAFTLVSKLYKSKQFRIKNTKLFIDDYFSGTPDVVLDSEGVVEDVKCSWTLKQFINAEITKLYSTQLQVYMHLTGCTKARLYYALLDTPTELILDEQRRFFYKYGCDNDNPDYQEAERKIDMIHKVSHLPEEKRLKCFEIEYDPLLISKLQERILLAREYYNTLRL